MATPPKKLVKPAPTSTPKKVEAKTETTKIETPKQTDFKIESGIPIPPRASGKGGRSGSKYPIRQLQVGESVFIEGKPTKVASAIQSAKKADSTYAFTSRVVTEDEKVGVRVWRTA
jgi:hypothetical protein